MRHATLYKVQHPGGNSFVRDPERARAHAQEVSTDYPGHLVLIRRRDGQVIAAYFGGSLVRTPPSVEYGRRP